MSKATPVAEPGDRAWPHEVAEEGREDASEGTGCSEAARERNRSKTESQWGDRTPYQPIGRRVCGERPISVHIYLILSDYLKRKKRYFLVYRIGCLLLPVIHVTSLCCKFKLPPGQARLVIVTCKTSSFWWELEDLAIHSARPISPNDCHWSNGSPQPPHFPPSKAAASPSRSRGVGRGGHVSSVPLAQDSDEQKNFNEEILSVGSRSCLDFSL